MRRSLIRRLSPAPTPAGRRPRRPSLERLEDRTVPATLLAGFTEAVVADGLSSATAMEIAPNGDLWVLEQGGVVKRFQAGSTAADVVGDLGTLGLTASGERGLLGIAFAPDYATSKQVYLYFTTTAGGVHNRISRFAVFDADATDYYFLGTSTTPADAGSSGTPIQTVVFDLDPLSSATNHNGGAIHFGPDGMLYAAVGDNANGANAQRLSSLHGKMLRLNADGSIPSDNPFFTTAAGNDRAIWALGLRNPFTFTFQPGTGVMFINDVGQNSFEEIDQGGPGANYGWPMVEGNAGTPPAGPGTYRAPDYTSAHGGGTFEGFAITGGAFYNPAVAQFPPEFAGDYFFADFVSSWINVLDVGSGAVTRFASDAPGTVDLKVSADGALYYLARGANQVLRVTSTVSQAPAITQPPQDATVPVGGTVSLSVTASGSAPLSYQWQQRVGDVFTDLGDGGPVSGATTATLTFTGARAEDAGQYRVVVSNGAGSATSDPVTLTVTANQAPAATISIDSGLTGGLFTAGQAIAFSATASDPEDGTLGASQFTWRVDHVTSPGGSSPVVRPFVPEFSGQTGGTFTPESTGVYTTTDIIYRVTLRVTDSAGLSTQVTRDIAPRLATLTVTTEPAGLQVTVDGQTFTAPHTFDSVVGFVRAVGAAARQTLADTTYDFVSWSDGGAATHSITTPAAATTYTATYEVAPVSTPGFLGQLYEDLLGRPIDTAGMTYWTQLLDNGGITEAGLAGVLLNTDEHRAHEVGQLYQALLGRAADGAGMSFWVGQLGQGASLRQVEAALLGSPEYFTRVGSTNDGFLAAAYTYLLGRTVDAGGLAFFRPLLQQGVSRTTVALVLQETDEGRRHLVGQRYQELLHRPADSGGLAFFAGLLAQGVPEEVLIQALVAAAEYQERP